MSLKPLVEMGDFAPYAGPERIVSAEPEATALRIAWDDGRQSRFHWIWLRDHCACRDCRHPVTRERLFELHDRSLSPRPQSVAVDAEGVLVVDWQAEQAESAGHRSRFDPGWLRRRAYDKASRAERQRSREPWDSAMAEKLPRFSYEAVSGDTEAQAQWLEALLETGVALLQGAPARAGELERFAEGIAPIRSTNFGRIFDVQSKPRPNNAAYTALALEPHVDLPNHGHPPDFQLLFCIANEAEGGDSTLVDGLQAAARLRDEAPEAFALLTTRAIDMRFHDEEVDIRHRVPLIELDASGSVIGLRFNNWIRDALDLPEEDVEPFYRAYQRLWRELRAERNSIRLRLRAGDLLAFDNRRILHGRTAFAATGARHLQGCYLDRSMLESRLRLLRRVLL